MIFLPFLISPFTPSTQQSCEYSPEVWGELAMHAWVNGIDVESLVSVYPLKLGHDHLSAAVDSANDAACDAR